MTSVSALSSLRVRLVLTLTGGAAILALLLFFAVRNFATQVAQQGQDNILSASAASILDSASMRDGQIEIDIPYGAFSMLSTDADDRVFYAIFQDAGFLSGYQNLPQPDQGSFLTDIYQDEPVRLVTATRSLIRQNGTSLIRVTLAQTQGALSGTLDQITRYAMLLGAGFFILTTALAFWATSTTIGQLKRLTNALTRRGPQDLRPYANPVPAEMVPLVSSLNSLMGRLDHSLTQSEDFIAEAAHRVRTPLATVRSHAETTLQRVTKVENRKALRSMVRAIDESSRAAGQLLDHAMITFRADHLERQNLDLVELVDDIVLRLTPIAEMKDLEIRKTGIARLAYSGDPILLQNAVRNLIDNALKYAPSESAIEIHVASNPAPEIVVRDAGPGFPDEELPDLATRFRRGKNAEGTIGSGLGLTIAQDVAKAHGGEMFLSNLKGGGACVTLSL